MGNSALSNMVHVLENAPHLTPAQVEQLVAIVATDAWNSVPALKYADQLTPEQVARLQAAAS